MSLQKRMIRVANDRKTLLWQLNARVASTGDEHQRVRSTQRPRLAAASLGGTVTATSAPCEGREVFLISEVVVQGYLAHKKRTTHRIPRRVKSVVSACNQPCSRKLRL